jgi:transposase
VVVDRFHVAKRYRKGLDELRKKELKRLKKELPEADYKEFKGVMWLRVRLFFYDGGLPKINTL